VKASIDFEKSPKVSPFILSDNHTDFLCIPSHVALQVRNPVTNRLEWKRVQDLQESFSKLENVYPDPFSSQTVSGFIDFLIKEKQENMRSIVHMDLNLLSSNNVNDKHPGILQAARFDNNFFYLSPMISKKRWFRGA